MKSRPRDDNRSFWPNSIRLRLTLWNVGVLALMLAGLGVALRYTLQATLIASVDRSLVHFARNIQQRVAYPLSGSLGQPFLPLPAPAKADSHDSEPFSYLRPHVLDIKGHPLIPTASADAPYDRGTFQLALAGQQTIMTIRLDNQAVRLLSVPLRRNERIVGVAQVPRPLTETYQEVRRLTNVLFLLATPALLIAGMGGAFLTNRALRPVRQITQAAGQIEADDLSARLTVSGQDELSELASTFNGMLDRLEEAFTRLERANAYLEQANERQRRFTADASHELKTPLTVIEGTVSLSLSGQRTAAQYRQSLETVGHSAGMMTKIVQDLLLLARSDAGQLGIDRRAISVLDILTLAREAISGQDHAPVEMTVTDSSLVIDGDPDHLVRLFVNLLDNAVRHTPYDGRIHVSAVGDEAYVTVIVKDTGVGIAAEHLPHIFERFYRVDAARTRQHGGTGLGLAICQSIVEAHGGSLSIDSIPDHGTSVSVSLPRAAVKCQNSSMNISAVPV